MTDRQTDEQMDSTDALSHSIIYGLYNLWCVRLSRRKTAAVLWSMLPVVMSTTDAYTGGVGKAVILGGGWPLLGLITQLTIS